MRMKIRDEKGITLVEVLAVLVILGILAMVAIPAIGTITLNAKKDAMIATAQQMVTAVRLMRANDVEPIVAGARPEVQSGGDTKIYFLGDMVNQGFIQLESAPFGTGYRLDNDWWGSRVSYNKRTGVYEVLLHTEGAGGKGKDYYIGRNGTYPSNTIAIQNITRDTVFPRPRNNP